MPWNQIVDSALVRGSFFLELAVLVLVAGLARVLKPGRKRILALGAIFTAGLLAALFADTFNAALGAGSVSMIHWLGIFAQGLCLIALVGLAVFRVALPRFRVDVPIFVQDIFAGVVYFCWTVTWLRANHVDVTSLVATSAVVTAVVGFSLQDTLGNLLGGVAIQLDHSIQVDDWIRVEDMVGRVVEIRWRAISIETRNWETVVIPNSTLVKNKFVVIGRRVSQPRLYRRTIPFLVDYRFPPQKVIEIVQTAMRQAEIPGASPYPEPECLLMDFMDSQAKYCVRYWLSDLHRDEGTDSQIRTRAFQALSRAEIPLAMPAYHVFLTQDTEERARHISEAIAQRNRKLLAKIDLFAGLHEDELLTLGRDLHSAAFSAGDVVTRQGAHADWLYLVLNGTADVALEKDGQSQKIAEIGPGSFFGEMGLMTGEPRTASVIARTNLDCLRLDKDAFSRILQNRPSLAEEISAVLAERRANLDAARASLDAPAREEKLSQERSDILRRVRRFFALEV